jgi:hypothetical protein
MTKRFILLAAAGLVVLGACSSSSKSSSSTTAAAAAQTTAAPATTSEAPTTEAPTTTAAATATSAAPAQTITITPDTGLTDQQVVHIVAKGYVAGKTYSAVECADKGSATGANDCDLRVIKVGTADSSGTVTVDFPAQKGPFGGNNIVCSAAQKCLISVANAGSANPTEVATQNITFAA